MTSWSAFKSLWNFQEFGRERHRDLDILMNIRMGTVGNSGGVYLIGCGNEIVYIGMTNNFRRRTLQSLGRCYPLVKDTTLPWSLALAPWGTVDISPEEECWESSAIKAFAPIYNTSIPSMVISIFNSPNFYKYIYFSFPIIWHKNCTINQMIRLFNIHMGMSILASILISDLLKRDLS
jgi:hypothetical protein